MQPRDTWKTFAGFALRVIVAHTLTYFIFGVIMSGVFHYDVVFTLPVIRDFMLPIDQHNVLIGPFMQPVRGLIFAIGLWPLRRLLLENKHGWLILWGLLVTVGILSTPAAAPSSIEGVLYTRLPLWYHLMGLPEILLQTLLFSIWVIWWERQAAGARQRGVRGQSLLVAEGVQAIVAACFGYIGYAVVGISLAALANANARASGAGQIDIGAAGANLKMQFMFVVAFMFNAGMVFWMNRRWACRCISLWRMFLLLWLVASAVPWVYQTLVLGGSSITTVALLGLFPAAIMTAVIWAGNRRLMAKVGKPA